jgi:addiction module HigA family antidote
MTCSARCRGPAPNWRRDSWPNWALDRQQFESAQALQGYAGTAPVSYQSGPVHKVRLHGPCDKALRATVYLWADHSRQACPWAQTYYQTLRQRGKTHACALRCLSPALAENPVEDVANGHPLRRGVASEKPAPPRVLGAHAAERLTESPHVNNFAQNSSCKPENISGRDRRRSSITGDTALRLGHFFGTSAEFWLNLQSLYELRVAQRKAGKAIDRLPTLKDSEHAHA